VIDVRYGVYLRPSVALAAAVADVQRALERRWGLTAAGRFMPHVTLKGFFRTDVTPMELRARLADELRGCPLVVLHNGGVTAFGTGAIVLDVDANESGGRNRSLHALHEATFRAMAPIVSAACDFTPYEHALDAYRAHLTLAMADIPGPRFTDILASVRSLQPIGPSVSQAAEVQLFAFASADWGASWWQTLTWRHVANLSLGSKMSSAQPARRTAAPRPERCLYRPAWSAELRTVPTISRFFGISIAMYFEDHGPAHFHAQDELSENWRRARAGEILQSIKPLR